MNGRARRDWRLILRSAILFGLIGGVFALIVQLDAIFIANQFEPTGVAAFVGTILGFLTFGSAGREAARRTNDGGAGWRIGALAGAIGEALRIAGGQLAVSLSPQGRAALGRLTAAGQQSASDPVSVALGVGLDLVGAIFFAALAGAIGAWAAVRFGVPPRDQ